MQLMLMKILCILISEFVFGEMSEHYVYCNIYWITDPLSDNQLFF